MGADQSCRNRLRNCTDMLKRAEQGEDVASRTLLRICDRIAAGQQVCLDLDFDFFFETEHATVDSWQKKRFDNPRFESAASKITSAYGRNRYGIQTACLIIKVLVNGHPPG